MKNLIFVITLNLSFVFFSIYSILGREYKGLDVDKSYLLTVFTSAVLSLFLISKGIILQKVIRKINFVFYLIPILFVFIYLIESPNSESSKRLFNLYIAFSFPATYIGTYLASTNTLQSFAKWFDFLPLIIIIGIIFSLQSIISVVLSINESFQIVSYMAALSFGLLLHSTYFGRIHERFYIFKSKLYLYISMLLMIFSIIIVFLSGGRGGFVELLLTFLILSFIKYRDINLRKILTGIAVIIAFMLITALFLSKFFADAFEIGSERIFSYITSEGIDFTKTAERDVIYNYSWQLIKENPITGYGIFKYADTFNQNYGYPHNIFIEYLLQGGIIYLSLWIVVLVFLFLKFKRMVSYFKGNLIMIPIALFPFTLLLFSDSYLMMPTFWFVVSFIANYNLPKHTLS